MSRNEVVDKVIVSLKDLIFIGILADIKPGIRLNIFLLLRLILTLNLH